MGFGMEMSAWKMTLMNYKKNSMSIDATIMFGENNINIMLLVPANTVSTVWWHDCVEDTTEYHAIKGRIRFLRDGKPSEFVSRNSYILIIYRKNE